MSRADWVDIKCPFYMRKEGYAIRCEKIVQGSTSTSSRFRDSNEQTQWLEMYCKSYNYDNCPFAKLAEDNPEWQ